MGVWSLGFRVWMFSKIRGYNLWGAPIMMTIAF